MNQPHSRHADAPKNHSSREEPFGTEKLDHDVRGRLEERVRDEEEG